MNNKPAAKSAQPAVGANLGQKTRMQRYLMALGAYVIAAALLVAAYLIDLIGLKPMLACIALMVVVNLFFFAMLASGRNSRFADPSMTLAQSLSGIALVMVVAFCFDRERSLVLVWCLVILLFGVFRFKPREFGLMTLFMLAGYALVINLLMSFKPERVDVYLEWYQWLWLALVLPAFAMVGARIGELRRRIQRSNEELTNALTTIQDMATHDSLTGLPNRASLSDTLKHAISRCGRNKGSLAVFFLDLDHFKSINDSLGHPAGDDLLREISRRITAAIRTSDLVARLGGDEFIVMVENGGDIESLRTLAEKILVAINQPVNVIGHELVITGSIGIAQYPQDGEEIGALLANADLAMYRAKETGRNRVAAYSADLGQTAQDRFEIERDMRRALEVGEFELYYQPKIDFRSGRMQGVEALIRWNHPVHGMLPPDRFIPIAEATNFIVQLGEWVLDQACRQARLWQEMRLPQFSIAVNLSSKQIADERLLERVAGALERNGTNPEMIELEITETAVMKNIEEAVSLLQSLRELGVKLAIDDFGTGYSSLSYLKQLPVDNLKVDRAFVRDLPHNRDDLAITRAVIAMAHGLSMRVVAEGVEGREQFHSLRDEGCDEFQGYYCRAAMGGSALEALVRKHGLQVPPEALGV